MSFTPKREDPLQLFVLDRSPSSGRNEKAIRQRNPINKHSEEMEPRTARDNFPIINRKFCFSCSVFPHNQKFNKFSFNWTHHSTYESIYAWPNILFHNQTNFSHFFASHFHFFVHFWGIFIHIIFHISIIRKKSSFLWFFSGRELTVRVTPSLLLKSNDER